MERVVVTGVGAVSSIGNDAKVFWESIISGRSGVDRIQAFDAEGLSTQIAAEVKGFSMPPKVAKRMERFTQFAVTAAAEALTQAGLMNGDGVYSGSDAQRAGSCVGTGIGGIPFLEEQHEKYLEKGAGRFHPLTVPIVIANIATANVAMQLQMNGPNLCVSTACATGNHSIGTAMDIIRSGRADVMIAGGTESTITGFALDGYSQLRALSTRNDSPQTASRPFSLSRDGFVLAEGAGVLVLESLSHAKARGAEILAEVKGFGMTSDAFHLTAPEPEGRFAAQAMSLALSDAGLNPDQIGYVNAHGTSTPLNDALETQAIKSVFGADAPPVSSIKSMIGHALGAAAGLEAVACVQAVHKGILPPTINLDEPDPELDLDYIPHTAREVPVQAVMSNSFAFGGQNAVVVFGKLS